MARISSAFFIIKSEDSSCKSFRYRNVNRSVTENRTSRKVENLLLRKRYDSGFINLGRFSQAYKSRFDEKLSVTLVKRR
jgi:hypothetical protein